MKTNSTIKTLIKLLIMIFNFDLLISQNISDDANNFVFVCVNNIIYQTQEEMFNLTKTDEDILQIINNNYVRQPTMHKNNIPDYSNEKIDINDVFIKDIDTGLFDKIQSGITKTINLFYKDATEKIPKFFPKKTQFKNVSQSQNSVFKAFAPEIFYHFRLLFGMNNLFKKSLSSSKLVVINTTKSKSKFFYTSDNKFVLKTISKYEVNLLISMLRKYFNYFCRHPNSLLPKFAGLYYVNYKDQEYYLIAMPNIYPYGLEKGVNRKYDLKGHNNYGTDPSDFKSEITFRLLDNDFINEFSRGLSISHNDHEELKKILITDTQFLKSYQITNYSLLLVTDTKEKIPDLKSEKFKENLKEKVIKASYYKKNIQVYIGIIDILQTYGFKRAVEHAYKSCLCNLGDKATIQHPTDYANRFINFITREVFTII